MSCPPPMSSVIDPRTNTVDHVGEGTTAWVHEASVTGPRDAQ
jgi:hypothetical protein